MTDQQLPAPHHKDPTFFHALFIDKRPHWREKRYELSLERIKELLSKSEISIDTIAKLPATSPFLKKSLKVVEKLIQKKSSFVKQQYLEFIKALREALCDEDYAKAYSLSLKEGPLSSLEGRCIALLHELCLILFTKVPLNDFCQELVDTVEIAGQKNLAIPSNDLPLHLTALCQTREAIKNAPTAVKIPYLKRGIQFLISQLGTGFDPYLQENTPYFYYHWKILKSDGTIKQVPAIRLGTPTQENIYSPFTLKAIINPEFRGFLQAYTMLSKKHLYINLQNRNPNYPGKNEAPRCRAIEKLQQEFPQTLVVMTLAKNTPFYHQSGPYQSQDDAALFKETLKAQFYEPDGGFFFCTTLQLHPYFERALELLLDAVHNKFFEERPKLTLEERQDFIEIYYARLQTHCIELTDVDSYNLSCKDGIDRAGGANALMYLDQLLSRGQELDHCSLQELRAILFAPAILVKKRAITPNRFERFISAAKRLLDVTPQTLAT